jgi:dimethylhistidine N-methyltransferase
MMTLSHHDTRPSQRRTPGARILDLHPETASFRDDVLAGLRAPVKNLPPKYFYDERGSLLFERITRLPEYYLTRTEISILESHAKDLARLMGNRWELVELGSGSSRKTRILLDAASGVGSYVPVDIARDALRVAVNGIAAEYPDIRVLGVCADYTRPFSFGRLDAEARRIAFFPGSTIGNFDPADASAFMKQIKTLLRPGDLFIVGVDLKKAPALLHAAYNDAAGVTAKFNINLLERMNRELGGNFDPRRFEHAAVYDVRHGRIEMHLRSMADQTVRVAGEDVVFRSRETIHTESSYKYTREEFRSLAREGGFAARDVWTDAERLFSVWILEPSRSEIG